MINKTKIALIAALAVGIASPAFAQSFNTAEGTGNELPFAYGIDASKPAYGPTRTVPHQQTAVRESNHTHFAAAGTHRLYNYAPIGSAAALNAAEDSSAATGGGSAGYNAMVETY